MPRCLPKPNTYPLGASISEKGSFWSAAHHSDLIFYAVRTAISHQKEGKKRILEFNDKRNLPSQRHLSQMQVTCLKCRFPFFELQIQKKKKLMVTRGKGWGGKNSEIGIDIYALLCTKQITNKGLLYSTKNSTQHSVMAYMRKESKKDCVYV